MQYRSFDSNMDGLWKRCEFWYLNANQMENLNPDCQPNKGCIRLSDMLLKWNGYLQLNSLQKTND